MRNYIAEFTLHLINKQTLRSSAKFLIDRLLQRQWMGDTHMRPIRPSDIRFTAEVVQNSVTTPSGQTGPLADFIDELVIHGDGLAAYVPQMRILYDKRSWWSLDNRRLYALRKAEEAGAVGLVRYKVVDLRDPRVRAELNEKKTTTCRGRRASVQVQSGVAEASPGVRKNSVRRSTTN